MKKEVNFRLFEVVNKSFKDKESQLLSKLGESLADGKRVVADRMMRLKDTGPSDHDLLGYYVKASDYIYGIMMRIAQAKDVHELPDDFTKGESVDVNKILRDVETKESEKMVCNSIYHFFIYKDFVVSDLPNSRPITCFQEYVNWLLLLEKSLCFSINPVIESGNIQLSRLKSVVIKDAFEPMPKEKKSGIRKVFDDVFSSLADADDLDIKELHDKKIVSASMTVNFDKPRRMTDADYEKSMRAILKITNKPQNIVFLMNNKQQLQGTQMLYSRIKTLENASLLSDMDYIHAMKSVIDGYVEESKK